ncbi:MAG: hypothetical protein KC431_27955, partial [Myxococcales bacterium]|nr:hypothetical protein [Myxococcales bacterium]
LDTAALSPVDIVRSLYAAWPDTAEDRARFLAEGLEWRVRIGERVHFSGEPVWFADPALELEALLTPSLTVEAVGDEEVEAACELLLRDGELRRVHHRARYRLHDGRISGGEISIDGPS